MGLILIILSIFWSLFFFLLFSILFSFLFFNKKFDWVMLKAFTEFALRFLHEHHGEFLHGQSCNELLAQRLFLDSTKSSNDPGRLHKEHEAEGGSATGVFATFQLCSKAEAIVHGGALGDAAAIAVFRHQVNKGKKEKRKEGKKW